MTSLPESELEVALRKLLATADLVVERGVKDLGWSDAGSGRALTRELQESVSLVRKLRDNGKPTRHRPPGYPGWGRR